MRLSKITLSNFRCFPLLDINLHSQLTVLVAENGQGKSSVLDAIRIVLWPFVSSFDLARNAVSGQGNAIAVNDVRIVKGRDNDMLRQLPCEISATGDFGLGSERTWSRYRESEAKRSKTKDAGDTSLMRQWAVAVQDQIRDPDKQRLDLPVFGYYGTGRLWAQKKLTEASKGADDTKSTDFYIRTFAYMNCLDPASSYKHFQEWFTLISKIYWEAALKMLEGKGSESAVSQAEIPLAVVQQAVDVLLQPVTGWHSLEYSHSHEESLVLHHDQHGVLKVDQLSDGIRSVLAMIGDIAYRCYKLNPHLGLESARQTQGVVMIDEVDMHLHPRWQQVILAQLIAAFPRIQFIVTTHSPQVLSTVRRENIRVLSPDQSGDIIATAPMASTYGEPSGDVMHSVMLVDPQPPVAEKADLQRLTEWVDQGRYQDDEAISLMSELTQKLGEQHPQLQRLRRSIQRQEALKR